MARNRLPRARVATGPLPAAAPPLPPFPRDPWVPVVVPAVLPVLFAARPGMTPGVFADRAGPGPAALVKFEPHRLPQFAGVGADVLRERVAAARDVRARRGAAGGLKRLAHLPAAPGPPRAHSGFSR